MVKRCRTENSEMADGERFDNCDCENYRQECDKLTLQVTELARQNRAYISEAQKYKTLLAESNQKSQQEQAENKKMKEEIKKETEQRNGYKKLFTKSLQNRLIDQKSLNAEKSKVSLLDQRIRDLEEKLKAAECHNAKLTSILAKFPPPRM